MQLIALEQLCMLLLMSDNVDRCFETCPPRTFLPALCKIFLDESAPDNVLGGDRPCHNILPGRICRMHPKDCWGGWSYKSTLQSFGCG